MHLQRDIRRPRAALIAALALACLLLAGGGALAEIDIGETSLAEITVAKVKEPRIKMAETDPEKSAPPGPPLAMKERPPVHVQCWQEGVKIIDETGLSELALSTILPQATRPAVVDGDAVGLKGRDDKGGKVLIVSVRDATCLVRNAS